MRCSTVPYQKKDASDSRRVRVRGLLLLARRGHGFLYASYDGGGEGDGGGGEGDGGGGDGEGGGGDGDGGGGKGDGGG